MNIHSINISLGNIMESKRHMYNGIECFLIIKGTMVVEVDGTIFHMQEDDLIIINRNQVHSMKGNASNIILSLKVGESYLEKECKQILASKIVCNSLTACEDDEGKYFDLKRLLTRMLFIYSKKGEGYTLEFYSLFYSFIHQLILNFKVGELEVQTYDAANIRDEDTVTMILNYINENYEKKISLEQIAIIAYMSPQYFSKFFKKKIGVGYLEYITNLRLDKAVSDLIYTNESVLKIAMNCGFANAKAFSNSFQKRYIIPPSEYRKNHKVEAAPDSPDNIGHQFDVEIEDGLLEFYKYIHLYNIQIDRPEASIEYFTLPLNDFSPRSFELPDKIINVNDMNALLDLETVNQLGNVQKALGIKYIHFAAFNTESSYQVDTGGIFDYYKYFKVFRTLQNWNLIPFIVVDYSLIKCNFPGENVTVDFLDFFRLLLQSLGSKFPLEFMERWKFQFQCSNKDDLNNYYDFYILIYKILKDYLPVTNIGILSITNKSSQEKDIFKQTLTYIKKKNCVPGFISFHSYPSQDLTAACQEAFTKLKNYHRLLLNDIKHVVKEVDCDITDYYMSMWNTLSSNSIVETGTFFRSAIILDGILSMMDKVSGIGFPLNTYEQNKSHGIVDTSYLSIYLYLQVKRPVFFVIEALNRMKGELVYHKDHILVTYNQKDTYSILLYHPCYVNPLYSIDAAYVQKEIRNIKLLIKDIKEGHYILKKFVYDKDNAGIFRYWEKTGCPDFVDSDVIDYLERAVVPEFTLHDTKLDSEFRTSQELSFNGVVLLTLKKNPFV